MRELYRHTDTIIAYELIPKRKYKYINKILSVYHIKYKHEKHYVIILKNNVVLEYYFKDEQKDIKKAVQIANGIYTNKIGLETDLIPTIYVLDENNMPIRYLKIHGDLLLSWVSGWVKGRRNKKWIKVIR